MSSTETAEKLFTKLSGFLISWAIPAVSWPERGQFLRLDQAVLCGAQVLQRLRQFPRALLLGLEQPHVLDGDHGLVGERLDQLDFALHKQFERRGSALGR